MGRDEERPGLLARFGLARPEARAWALYDWANSAFWTVIITAVFPVYYKKVAAELPVEEQDLYFTVATGIALAVIAASAPILGAVADYRPCKKRFLGGFAFLGAAASALMRIDRFGVVSRCRSKSSSSGRAPCWR